MNNSGIIAQYGFLFQRAVFFLYVIENIGERQLFTFEGKDDVEISADESIYEIKEFSNRVIQVKSGNITEDTYSKVICNWLFMDMETINSYELVIENEMSFDHSSRKRAENIYDFIISGKDKKRSSIARKAYDKYKSIFVENPESFIDIVETLTSNITVDVVTLDDIDRRMKSKFYSIYCSDIVNYEKAKSKRLERFLSCINSSVDESIKAKRQYVLTFDLYIQLITKVIDEISDNKYSIDTKVLKNKLKEEAFQIVNERAWREVNQLCLVNSDENFIIDGIANELIYKDFRSVYEQQKEVDINNLEQNAKENYESAKFSLGKGADNPKDLYLSTTNQHIESDLIPPGPIYRKGCYVFLTGESIEQDIQITWGDSDGSE